MQGGQSPSCTSHREIPAFAGMGKFLGREWGKGREWGGFYFGGEMGERGEREDGGVRMREQTQKLKELPIIKLPPI